MKRFGTRSATGKMVKLKLPVDVESLLIEASNRSGRSESFEAVIRLKDIIFTAIQSLTGQGISMVSRWLSI
ncbi:TraY domain-containing protein (plasmid) [Salmonella enterica subsp. enterica serovar Typhimurium]|uniref:TraY domain-containing protein n=1 Tax=Salmonella enterica TaxID=28901 RepID=UPI0030D1C584